MAVVEAVAPLVVVVVVATATDTAYLVVKVVVTSS